MIDPVVVDVIVIYCIAALIGLGLASVGVVIDVVYTIGGLIRRRQ